MLITLSRALLGACLLVIVGLATQVFADNATNTAVITPAVNTVINPTAISTTSSAGEPVSAGATHCVPVGADFRFAELLPVVQVAIEGDAVWPLATAAQQPYKSLTDSKVGYLNSGVWARFCVTNSDSFDRALVLDSGDKYFTRAGLFVVEHAVLGQGGLTPLLSAEYGTEMPYAIRPIRARNIVFPLTIRAGQSVDVYISYRGEAQIRVAPVLYDQTAFVAWQHRDDVVVYIFYGALIALFVYNLLLAFGSKEPAAYVCIALIGSWTLLISGWDGVLYQWWPESLGFYQLDYIYLSVSAAVISLAVFTVEYLQLRQLSWRFVWPQYFIVALAIVFIPLVWVLPKHILRDMILMLFGLTLVGAITTGAILLFRRGQGHAGVYVAGYLVMLFALFAAIRSVYLPSGGYGEVEIWVRFAILAPIAIFCLGVGYRINQLKTSATENQQRALLARAEAEFKSRFLVTMSHEIRTPLNGVVGMIELLQGTPLSDMQRRYVDVIHSSGRALMDVINDVLDFSKLEHGKVKLEIIGFNLERLVDECIDVFAITKKSGSVVFNACIEPGTPLLVMGDPTRTKQILINLVGNAFKFTQVGEVNLAISQVLPSSVDGASSLKFEVSDTGIGMDREGREQLFTAFTQADGSITRKYGGTGLGLAICKQLVELMGGTIGVESQPGIGSTFWFTLPLVLPSSGTVIDPIARAPVLIAKQVLVVDDHDAFCHTMRVALESFGMIVTVAQTAQAARDCLRQSRYDVLMIDRCLPDQDGLELAQDLYRNQGREQARIIPPILLVSVAVDILEDHTLTQAGIVAHMIKPISLNNLHNRLVRLFDAEQTLVIPPTITLANANGTPLRALVAEDNHINQIVIGGLLNKLGVEAVFVGDGKQAVDVYVASLDAKQKPFDVIIMDCEMPHLDGYSATRHIRQHEAKYNPTRSIRIIGLTAHAIDEYRERAFAAGMHDFLTKPVHFETLKRALAQVK
jgi:signal transduction histidine kinase/DNA-binding response OmpR family regulator